MHTPVPATSATPCPRCGRPIVWTRRERGAAPTLAGWKCFCNLTNREWFALAAVAAAALAEEQRRSRDLPPPRSTS